MARYKNVDGVRIQMTPQEDAEVQVREAAWEAEADVRKAEEVRNERDAFLTEVDAVAGNALRWAALDADTQAAWATYRQALLDVPQQSGFPNSVAWPQEPSGQ
jgi:hypothetical protein